MPRRIGGATNNTKGGQRFFSTKINAGDKCTPGVKSLDELADRQFEPVSNVYKILYDKNVMMAAYGLKKSNPG
jgi:hypothetical protein